MVVQNWAIPFSSEIARSSGFELSNTGKSWQMWALHSFGALGA